MTVHFNLNNEISKELLVNKVNTILDSQGRLAPMATKASPVTRYSKARIFESQLALKYF